MSELRINKDRVSHIKIYDFHKTNYIWCKEKPIKFLWFINDGKYQEGYWLKGKQDPYNWMATEEYIQDCIDIDGTLVEKPKVKIFTGKYQIKSKYFETLEEAKKYCSDNFPNVNVTVE